MCSGTNEFRMLGSICIVLYHKNGWYYITFNVVFELRKSDAGPPPRYWNTLLKTRGQTRGVPEQININNDLFTLHFCIHLIYRCTSPYRRFQATRPCSLSPVENESEGDGPRSSDRCSHDYCRIPDFRALSDQDSDTWNKIPKNHLFVCHITTNNVHTVNTLIS